MIELNNLNRNQKEAVFTKSAKVLVMSGAGAGKTKVLTNRIAFLMHIGVNETDIIAFTFTNKAAKEMRNRLNKLLARKTDAFIGTFHSFCYVCLKDSGNYYKLGFTAEPEIITEYEKSKLIKDILSDYNKDYSNIPFVSAISKIKNGVAINEITGDDRLILNAVYAEYQTRLKHSSMIDFDDMVPLFLKLAEVNPDYFDSFCQFKYVLVDECQDTNQIQYDLIKKVSSKYQNIFMVGDEDQLIYSFRSSDIAFLNDFKNQADEIIILNENYRCNKEILKVANKLISYNFDRLEKNLISNIEAKEPVSYQDYLTQTDEAISIVNRIKHLHLKGEQLTNIAILYRNNYQMYAIEKILAKEKIPYVIYGAMAFYEYADVRTIINVYRFLQNPYNEIAFEAIYNKPVKHIDDLEIKDLFREYHKQRKDLITFLYNHSNPKLSTLGITYLKLKGLLNKLEPSEFYMQVLHHLKYEKYLKESSNQKAEYTRLMMLKDMLTDLKKEEALDFFNNLILENVNVYAPTGVSLMTIHKSKGLEFNTVFIIGCNDGIIPGFSKKSKDIEEDRRVFYVALTRAKQNLFLSSSTIHYINGQQYKLKPSQFLTEAGIAGVNDFFGNYFYNK